jgi:hypothetical protein
VLESQRHPTRVGKEQVLRHVSKAYGLNVARLLLKNQSESKSDEAVDTAIMCEALVCEGG